MVIHTLNDPVKHLMGNSPDLHLNVILEHISSLGIISSNPVS